MAVAVGGNSASGGRDFKKRTVVEGGDDTTQVSSEQTSEETRQETWHGKWAFRYVEAERLLNACRPE